VFLRYETQEDYEWAIDKLIQFLHTSGATITWPAVVVTDRELALTKAREEISTVDYEYHFMSMAYQ
jgi:hypothetical protein